MTKNLHNKERNKREEKKIKQKQEKEKEKTKLTLGLSFYLVVGNCEKDVGDDVAFISKTLHKRTKMFCKRHVFNPSNCIGKVSIGREEKILLKLVLHIIFHMSHG